MSAALQIVGVDDLLSVEDVLQKVPISRSKLHEYVRDGTLRAVKFGRRTLFRPRAVQEFIESMETGGRAKATIRGI